MPNRNQPSQREQYPYHPDYHVVETVADSIDGNRIAITTSKFPDGQTVCFRIALEKPGVCLVTDDGAIANQLGKVDGFGRTKCFDDVQLEHWDGLNFVFKTQFGDGPANMTIIEAGGPDRDTALSRIIGATRNFIVAESKVR